jgi:NIPSNAP protein
VNRLIEIRSYNLKPGSRDQYHRLVLEKALPLLRRWKVDVVAFGPSPHDEDSYYLIRAFADLAERERSEDAFYGSDEWREGPRQEILALIDTYTTIVLELDEAVIQGLRS